MLAAVTCWEEILGLAHPVGTVQLLPKVLELARLKLSDAGSTGSLGLGLMLGLTEDDGEAEGDALGLNDIEADGLAEGDADGLAEGEADGLADGD